MSVGVFFAGGRQSCSGGELRRRIGAMFGCRPRFPARRRARAGAGATDNVDARIDATKVFYGINPPTRKFRIDDIHQPPTGAMGVCKGFHLWHYQDGKIIRKGVVITPASSGAAANTHAVSVV
jgi:hypothetical protein